MAKRGIASGKVKGAKLVPEPTMDEMCATCGATWGEHKGLGDNCPKPEGEYTTWADTTFKRRRAP